MSVIKSIAVMVKPFHLSAPVLLWYNEDVFQGGVS